MSNFTAWAECVSLFGDPIDLFGTGRSVINSNMVDKINPEISSKRLVISDDNENLIASILKEKNDDVDKSEIFINTIKEKNYDELMELKEYIGDKLSYYRSHLQHDKIQIYFEAIKSSIEVKEDDINFIRSLRDQLQDTIQQLENKEFINEYKNLFTIASERYELYKEASNVRRMISKLTGYRRLNTNFDPANMNVILDMYNNFKENYTKEINGKMVTNFKNEDWYEQMMKDIEMLKNLFEEVAEDFVMCVFERNISTINYQYEKYASFFIDMGVIRRVCSKLRDKLFDIDYDASKDNTFVGRKNLKIKDSYTDFSNVFDFVSNFFENTRKEHGNFDLVDRKFITEYLNKFKAMTEVSDNMFVYFNTNDITKSSYSAVKEFFTRWWKSIKMFQIIGDIDTGAFDACLNRFIGIIESKCKCTITTDKEIKKLKKKLKYTNLLLYIRENKIECYEKDFVSDIFHNQLEFIHKNFVCDDNLKLSNLLLLYSSLRLMFDKERKDIFKEVRSEFKKLIRRLKRKAIRMFSHKIHSIIYQGMFMPSDSRIKESGLKDYPHPWLVQCLNVLIRYKSLQNGKIYDMFKKRFIDAIVSSFEYCFAERSLETIKSIERERFANDLTVLSYLLGRNRSSRLSNLKNVVGVKQFGIPSLQLDVLAVL